MLRSIDLISVDPAAPELRAVIDGSLIPVMQVLDELASGELEQDIAERRGAKRDWPDDPWAKPIPLAGVRAAAAYGTALAAEETLPAPAAAGFAERRLGELKIEEAKAWAPTVLRLLAHGVPREEVLSRHPRLSNELLAAAVRYGAALARHDPLAAQPEPAEATFLRDCLLDEDRKLIDDFYSYRRETGGLLSPERIFSNYWIRLVEDVEGGYDDIFPEYTMKIQERDELEEVVSLVSPTSQVALLDQIRPWDRRFEAATYPSSQMLLMSPRRLWEPRRWWWYRLPKRVGPQMARELHQRGFF